jgi:hypothetical protein
VQTVVETPSWLKAAKRERNELAKRADDIFERYRGKP